MKNLLILFFVVLFAIVLFAGFMTWFEMSGYQAEFLAWWNELGLGKMIGIGFVAFFFVAGIFSLFFNLDKISLSWLLFNKK